MLNGNVSGTNATCVTCLLTINKHCAAVMFNNITNTVHNFFHADITNKRLAVLCIYTFSLCWNIRKEKLMIFFISLLLLHEWIFKKNNTI